MGRKRVPWAPPLAELPIGVAGLLFVRQKTEADRAWLARASGVQDTRGQHVPLDAGCNQPTRLPVAASVGAGG